MSTPVIVCAFDENYAMPAAVMLRSMDETARPDCEICVYLLIDGVSRRSQRRIEKSVSTRLKLEWIRIDGKRLANLPVSKHITKVAYARILIPELLPHDIDHVLYIDCDLLFYSDVFELWESYDPKFAIQAVPEIGIVGDGRRGLHKSLNIPNEHPYLADGLMLMNLSKWREIDATQKIFNYLSDHRDIIQYHDMDGINAVLWNDWQALDRKWYKRVDCAIPMTSDALCDMVQKLRDNGGIMHFASAIKPWDYGVQHPVVALYFEHVNKTAWKGWRPPYPYWDSFGRFVRYRLLNRYFYGGALRKIPLLGEVWARMRVKMKEIDK